MSDRIISAADKMYIAVIEFINDWKNGDFELPRLAVFDLEAVEKCALEYSFSKIPTTPEEVMEFERNNIIKERTTEEIRASWEKLKKMISEKEVL